MLQKPRNRWGKDPLLTSVRRDLHELLAASGGVLGAQEAVMALLERRGSVETGEHRFRRAVAVLRASLEAEGALKEPRFSIQRRDGRVVLSSDAEAAFYAFALGDEADRIASNEVLLPARRCVELLRQIKAPAGSGLDDGRLVRLASIASRTAAVSPRLELYPRGMAALRAAKLASHLAPAIGPGGQSEVFSAQEVQRRVAGRFPDAQALPGRPELDALLQEADWNTEWDPQATLGRGGYRSRAQGALTTSSATIPFQPTIGPARVPDSEDAAQARRFDERLRIAAEQGGFLVLTVDPKYMARAEREIARQYGVRPWSIERALVQAMKEKAVAARVAWDVVLKADASPRNSTAWRNLLSLVRKAMDAATAALPRTAPPALLTCAGLLSRYEQMSWISDLAIRSGQASGVHGAWLLVPWQDPGRPPMIDGQAVPVLASQRAHIPDGWLANSHRAGRSASV